MPDIVLGTIKVTDEEVQLFTPSDPYRYDVDNRPLRSLISNDVTLYNALSTVVDWLNAARDGYDTLADRLDAIQQQIDEAAGPAYLIGDNSEPFVFDASNNVLKVKVDDQTDWQVVTFPTGTLTAAEVVNAINDQTTGVVASVASANRVKIASATSGTSSRVFIASVADGSTANVVLGFDSAGESTDFSTLEGRVSAIEEEIIAARFARPTLADFLAVSHNPDGTIRDDAITFTATTLRNLTLSGARKQTTLANGIDAVAYNVFYDPDGGIWIGSDDVKGTSWYNETLGTSTRGNRREYPTQSYVVVTDNELKVFDLMEVTSPELWMQFSFTPAWVSGTHYTAGAVVYTIETSGVKFWRATTDHDSEASNAPGVGSEWEDVTGQAGTALFGVPTKVAVKYGRIIVGTENTGLFVIDLIQDKIYWYSDQGRRVFVGAVAHRNDYGLYDVLISDYALPSNNVRDVAVEIHAGHPYYFASTSAGACVMTPANQTLVFTHPDGSSSTAVAALAKSLAFSMGPTGSESTVYLIKDFTTLTAGGNAETVADVYYGAHTVPAFDTYPTTSLDLVLTDYGLAILRGSSHGLKVVYERGSRAESWAQYFLTSRDASLLMKGDVRGCWVMDLNVAPDEPVDDLSHNQFPLIAKGSPFVPVADGAVHLFAFNGTNQYLINFTDPEGFHFEPGRPITITFMMVFDEVRDCTLLAKWNEATPAREWKVSIEGGALKFTLFDEDNDGYIARQASVAAFDPGKRYFVQISYSGTGNPDDITFVINGSVANGPTETGGTFAQMRATSVAFTVGAHTASDGSMTNFYHGKLGLLMICAEPLDDVWSFRTRRQIDRWLNVTSTRLPGSTNRAVDVAGSPAAGVAYVALSNGVDTGAVARVGLESAVVLDAWSSALGTRDQDDQPWASDNILSVSSGGSIRAFLNAGGVWYEMDPIDLRLACTYLGDFSIDGIVVHTGGPSIYQSSYYYSSGGTLTSEVITLTAADVSNGYVTLSRVPTEPRNVVAYVVGDGVLINAEATGADSYPAAPDFVVKEGKLIFRNGVTVGTYTSSGLAEEVGDGDTLVVMYSA